MKGRTTMKKLVSLLLALTMALCLAACGSDAPTTPTEAPASAPTEAPTKAADEPTVGQTPDVQQPDATAAYSFSFQGVELVPGQAFDAGVLAEPASVYQIPSCAIEGTDNVYNYGVLELTAFNDGSGEVLYSIFLIDANTPTPEGLYLGDTLDQVTTLYGTEYTENGTQITFQKGVTQLVLLVENNIVTSIEYRLDIG